MRNSFEQSPERLSQPNSRFHCGSLNPASLRHCVALRALALCLAVMAALHSPQLLRQFLAAPAPPRIKLIATPLSQTSIRLDWQLVNISSATAVQILCSPSPDSGFTVIRNAGATVTSYTNTTLSPGTTYYYQARTYSILGARSLTSDVVSAKTLAADPTPTTTPTPTPTPISTPTPTALTGDALRGIYVATNGTPKGDGSPARPLDIATALSTYTSPARPGDTIWIRGGTYKANEFRASVWGLEGAPITIRAYPGERVILDAPITAWAVLINEGAWTTFWGLEVTCSDPDRTKTRPAGVNIYGHHTRFINLVIHDTGSGVGFWAPAVDAEIYGCIIYRNGWQGPSPDRGHGHGIYMQNDKGAKHVVDNIVFNQYGFGIHAYTEKNTIRGFHIEGNTLFGNGSPATPANSDYNNLLVGGLTPAERIEIVNNYLYHPLDLANTTNCGLYYSARNNKDVTVRDNYMAGGSVVAWVQEWESAVATGNTFIGSNNLLTVGLPDGVPNSAYTWNNNSYLSTTASPTPTPFIFRIGAGFSALNFSKWKQTTGYDANSQFAVESDGQPNGVKIFVRPNQHEAGRANITIFNWDRKPSIDVDASGALHQGMQYEVRNVNDLFGAPVATGIYNGQPVRIPMPSTAPGPVFAAFVLTPVYSTSTTPTPTPTPKPTPTPTPTPKPTPTPTPTPTQDSKSDSELDEEEKKLFEMINQYRLQNGRNPLGASISLTSASHWHSQDMTEHSYLNRIDSLGRTPSERARDFGFPGELAPIEENTLVAVTHLNSQHVFDTWSSTASGNFALLRPSWKVAGVARWFDETASRWFWNVTFGAYWDKTILLAGEDDEGRIDHNNLIRTRPPAESLSAGHRFSGYGDDDAPYDPVHCDLDSSPQICWRDPPPQTNARLNEPSLPQNLIGKWAVQYIISSRGIVHANLGEWDRAGLSIEFQINPGGSWTMRGYRSFQSPQPTESGSWQSVHDSFRNEEVVTFIRQNGAPRAIIRVHAAQDQLTFFAVDGGGMMRNFLRGVAADNNRNNDPQVIFLPKEQYTAW